MNVIFMGSAAFAIPSLDALLRTKHQVSIVVCQPDKPAGRGLVIHPCPIAQFARSNGLKLYQPNTLKNDETIDCFRELKPDFIIVVAYGKILPKVILDIPQQGCVNVHASLLPKYRGAAPINWSIANGDKVTGITTMFINERMDAGDILIQKELEIGPAEIAPELHNRLAILGADILIETLVRIEKKNITRTIQDEAKATYAPILKKENGLINWNSPAKKIDALIRGMQPWPVAHTYLDGKLFRIFKAKVKEENCQELPGTIIRSDGVLSVATKEKVLYLEDVQLEGKKRMSVDAFLRGHVIRSESFFGRRWD